MLNLLAAIGDIFPLASAGGHLAANAIHRLFSTTLLNLHESLELLGLRATTVIFGLASL